VSLSPLIPPLKNASKLTVKVLSMYVAPVSLATVNLVPSTAIPPFKLANPDTVKVPLVPLITVSPVFALTVNKSGVDAEPTDKSPRDVNDP
jgi:hypothetical protein